MTLFSLVLHITENWKYKILFVSQRFFSEHVFFKISHCIFKIVTRKLKQKNNEFLNLCGLRTESFLAIWLSVPAQVSYKK